MSVFTKILSSGEGKKAKALAALVPHINAQEEDIKALSDDDLRAKTGEFRGRLDQGEELDGLLIEAFAVMREASMRVIGQRHYDVQLMGGAALHFGWIAEMKTGEGKTLVSTLPVYLNGLSQKGVHVVTVNDYLASRDSEWMGQIHRWLGLTVGLIVPSVNDPAHKREQYLCDVTYGTNNEMGFDYLRDNMAMDNDNLSQRGYNFCIVDEVDSILIDEARTPLIISGRFADANQTYYRFASIVAGLEKDFHYEVDEEKRTVVPTEEGIHAVEQELGIENLYDSIQVNYVHQLQAALRAKELYRRDKEYVVQNGEVKIVDEFTGRILDGRRWAEGLHQAVEAKEGTQIKEENQTLATITLQNYFRLYDKLAGMTGTALTEANEFHATYQLEVVSIDTHKPTVRKDEPDYIYSSEDTKFEALAKDISERQAEGQPILVGTISVEKSEKLSKLLDRLGVDHEVLNAKQHTREAEVVAQAGRPGVVTVATNMAGRGVDIILGGNPEALALKDLTAEGLDADTKEGAVRLKELLVKHEEACAVDGEKVRQAGGLYVLGTERHESRRIDNQLRGRSGRQGDPGESRFYLSLDDDLLRIFATGAMNWVMARSDEGLPIVSKMVTRAVERAQTTVEQRNTEIRKNVLKYDEVMNEQRKVIYALREQLLSGSDLGNQTHDSVVTVVDNSLDTYFSEEGWDIEGILAEIHSLWPTQLKADEIFGTKETLSEKIVEDAMQYYESRKETLGEEAMKYLESYFLLRIIDQRWREHLYDMDYLREGINLRALGQKDPLTEWQREAFEYFEEMMNAVSSEYVKYIMHSEIQLEPVNDANGEVEEAGMEPVVQAQKEAQPQRETAAVPSGLATSGPAGQPQGITTSSSDEAPARTVVKTQEQKVGRNDSCHCGSGKKFKHCHGR